MKKIFISAVITISFLFPLSASSHPGNTDAYGCHTCRTNCAKWGLDSGEYHCHNAKALPQPLPPVTSHKTGVTEPAPQYTKPVVQPVVKPTPIVEKPVVKTVPAVKPIVQPTPKPAKKPIEKPAVKPVTKPVEKSVTKPMVTSTPTVKPKMIAPAPAKQSWWNKMVNWF